MRMPISGKTQIVGVMGDPVAHSLSPAMHQAAFAQLGLDWVYVPFHVPPDQLGRAVKGIAALGLRGVNVTVPHKVRVMEYLDEIDDEARVIGAVNTIVHREGRLIGHNTDGRGFLRSLELEAGCDPAGKTLLLLGAGGAALAIAQAVAAAGAKSVVIANRTVKKAEELAQAVAANTACKEVHVVPLDAADPRMLRAAADAEIVVQTTTVGMSPHHEAPPVLPAALISPEAIVVDIVYNPRETRFVQEARARGCRVVTGEGMLAFQGAISFEIWTGHEAPSLVMLETLRQHLDRAG